MIEETTKKTVKSVLDSQRREGEARAILQDVEKLISQKPERKLRWVWELIQNAKDQAINVNKVNIYFHLSKDRILIEHDGDPFEMEHLIALVRKTSTKPLEGLDGNTGKWGSGFVTTHVLNKQVTVSGLLKNNLGCRPFRLLIDRSSEKLPELLQALDNAYDKIDEINELPPCESKDRTSYEYTLDEDQFSIAKNSLKELERNLPFTLLINNTQISSVTITDELNPLVELSVDPKDNIFSNIGFSKINGNDSNNSQDEYGLIFKKDINNSLIIALPAVKTGEIYSLIRIENQARIFRNFPLIGTEDFHFPCFVHSNTFQPSEPRDGIRVLKEREDKEDKHADDNRKALITYVELFKELFIELLNNKVNNIHLLAESGLPLDNQNYIDYEWFKINIQKHIRDFLISYDIVKTVDGGTIKIPEAKFIMPSDPLIQEEFYLIVSELYPSNCPNFECYKDWQGIIEQDKESWVQGISVGIENVVEIVESKKHLDNLIVFRNNNIRWLNDLIGYIIATGRVELTEKCAIYPNQSKEFKKRFELRIDPGFDDKFKVISKNIFKNLYDDFILIEITNITGILPFEIGDYFISLNNYIGNLDCNKSTPKQTNSIFELGCYFKNANAPKRNEWFELINTLLPSLAPNKSFSTKLEDFNFEPTDKWTLKYVCSQIEKTETFGNFCLIYFKTDADAAYSWLNKFLSFIFRTENSKELVSKYSIILTQDGIFNKYDDYLFMEDKPESFEDVFKDLIKDYLGKGDPRKYLIDAKIRNDSLRARSAKALTEQIDNIFNDIKTEKEVEEGGRLNPLFHKLNDWFGKQEEERSRNLFPIFTQKRPDLSVRAFGKEMSKIVMEKGIDEIKALSKLKLNASDLQKLEHAVKIAGGIQVLLDKAQEIFEEAEDIRNRKKIGKAAEEAFLEALLEADIEDAFNVENPDFGKDFTIKSKITDKEYYIEIKSTVIGKETVKMSKLQGETANIEKNRYSLSVITRPSGFEVNKEYFKQHSRFVPEIGNKIGNKIEIMIDDLKNLEKLETGNVNITMDNKNYAVYVNKVIWEDGVDFSTFVEYLKKYLISEGN